MPGAGRAAGAVTLGVEEEFVLLDPSTGAVVPAAPDLVRLLGGEPGVRQELMRFQVETATGVCTGLDQVGRELARLRRLAADGAAVRRLIARGAALSGHDPAAAGPAPQSRQRPGAPPVAALRESILAAAPPSVPPRSPAFALAGLLASFAAGTAAFWSACAGAASFTGSFFAGAFLAADRTAPASAVSPATESSPPKPLQT